MIMLNAQIQQGWIILIVGITIVFIALISLFLIYQYLIPAILNRKEQDSGNEKAGAGSKGNVSSATQTGEEMAAIAAAVYLFLEETHDEENAILTIGKTSKSYSPWSSKIYTTHHVYGLHR